MAAEGDTIAAIATPRGEGGIGIVRVSGFQSVRLVQELFHGARSQKVADMPTYSAQYGRIVDPETGDMVDEVVVMVMRAPGSYTREDVVEVQCHGGPAPLRRVLELLLQKGARLAQPGEFTRRAFLNGRLDLAQAEAVMDVIRSQTDRALEAAVQQLDGCISRAIKDMRQDLLGTLAQVEAEVDFAEDEVHAGGHCWLQTQLAGIQEQLQELVSRSEKGKVIKEGLRTLIVGKVNVGKSSLLNALVEQERVLVTEVPGTTRDAVEEVISLGGIPLRLMDTAGLRAGGDWLESLGMQHTRRFISQADLVLVVLDGHRGLSGADEEISRLVRHKSQVVAINKKDLGLVVTPLEAQRLFPGAPVVEIAARWGWGLRELEQVVAEVAMGGAVPGDQEPLVTSVRHQKCLARAGEHLHTAYQSLQEGIEVDLLAIDLRECLEALGEITGDTASDELLDRVFRDFCIGK